MAFPYVDFSPVAGRSEIGLDPSVIGWSVTSDSPAVILWEGQTVFSFTVELRVHSPSLQLKFPYR